MSGSGGSAPPQNPKNRRNRCTGSKLGFVKDRETGLPAQARHHELIEAVSREKVTQNKSVKELLLKTGNLNLRPDHKDAAQELPSYRFYEIYMKIRKELQGKKKWK